MSFTPLDTSTQRERINVSRSGTMGIRRPPTRRHTPAALICSSPEDGPEAQRPEDGQIIVDSDDNLRDTPDPVPGKLNEQSGISIVGFKNISPKIRVGFPVEIQLELQTKLRSSSTLEREHQVEEVTDSGELGFDQNNQETDNTHQIGVVVEPTNLRGTNLASNGDSTAEIKERRRSLLSEHFESSSTKDTSDAHRRFSFHQFGSNHPNNNSGVSSNTKSQRSSIGFFNQSDTDRSAGTSLDIMQNMQLMRQNNNHASKLYSSSSGITLTDIPTSEDFNPSSSKFTDDVGYESNVNSGFKYDDNQKGSFTQQLKTINNGGRKTVVMLNASLDSLHAGRRNSLEFKTIPIDKSAVELREKSPEQNDKSFTVNHDFECQYYPDGQLVSTPDVLHHDNSSSNSLSPSLERSRKLLKMLDETPDLLNKMSFRSYFSTSDKQETKDWDEEKDEMDWETQRQLSFLNDSLSRILDETRHANSIIDATPVEADQLMRGVPEGSKNLPLFRGIPEVDFNGNLKDMKMSQVSQTWISSVDPKPAQTVRDNDVVTSISATNDALKKGPKKVEFCKTEVHFTPDSGRFNIVETDDNKPSTAHLFRRKKREKKSKEIITTPAVPASQYSSSSSMSSLDSTSGKTESVHILEMRLSSETSNASKQKDVIEVNEAEKVAVDSLPHVRIDESKSTLQNKSKLFQNEWNASLEKIHAIVEASSSQDNNQAVTDHHNGSLSIEELKPNGIACESPKDDIIHQDNLSENTHKIFVNLERRDNVSENYEEDVRSPSHPILSNYGELKIQRYLKQLKTNSRENSSSPVGSPTPQENGNDDGHFRFDNILYDHGSFVPLATRRSLIEMNNRNRKRLHGGTSSDNSSTTSTYSLPTSDKEQYGSLRLGTVEATVLANRNKAQITSVEFRYTNDNDRSESDYHNLSVKERRERFSSVPSPVLPFNANNYLRDSGTSPTKSHASDSSCPSTPFSYSSKKPPTPILPLQFAAFEKAGAQLRERIYAKAENVAESEVITQSVRSKREENKTALKSVVTIGGSDYSESVANNGSGGMHVTSTAITAMEDPESILSLDNTWKGNIETHQDGYAKKGTGPRSLTFPKPGRTEPDWVSKAKSRETRVTDWSFVEKQQSTRNTEPPWMSELRLRNKVVPSDEAKSLPKISVVYPWQRESSSKEVTIAKAESSTQENSHIVSIVPEPSSTSASSVKEDKRGGSYDLYSGKSLPPIKSLKAVPEISLPSRKSRSIVEVNSEPELYAKGSSQKYRSQGKKEIVDVRRGESVTKAEKKSSSMRVVSETGMSSKSKREVETLPKKSRRPLQISHANKETIRERVDEESRVEQTKPPKPPQRVASHSSSKTREPPALMTIPPFRDGSHRDRSSGTGGSTYTSSSVVKKSSTKRKSGLEDSLPILSSDNGPVHHRHPTIQISKLPMRTAKVSIVDGKRLSSGGSKSKPKQGQYKIGNKLSVSCRLF